MSVETKAAGASSLGAHCVGIPSLGRAAISERQVPSKKAAYQSPLIALLSERRVDSLLYFRGEHPSAVAAG